MEAKKSLKSPRNSRKSKPTDPYVAPFAAKKLVAGLHHSPSLVGSIVEKGFSPSPANASGNGKSAGSVGPEPTVLPFPVARHRSHGPHWAPANSMAVTAADDEGFVEEDDQAMEYDAIAMFADPMVRKEKKGLDFSFWKELLDEGDSVKPKPRKFEQKKGGKTTGNAVNSKGLTSRAVSGSNMTEKIEKFPARLSPSASELPLRDEFGSTVIKDELVNVGREVDGGAKPRVSTNDVEMLEADRRGSRSLVDDINDENLVRLQQMSSGEIAEAQAEILEKMDPAIIEMLKRRGQQRVMKKKGDGHAQGSKEHNESSSNGHGHAELGKNSVTPVTSTELLHAREHKSSAWNAWSRRVEKVRDLRFSLDGDVIESGVSLEQPYGEKRRLSPYGIENVAERDFLRSEGDPAAVGYTINEAAALTRSLIPGQRAIALQLISSILRKALLDFHHMENELYIDQTNSSLENFDWQAVWAFALGPEPQLALSLRIALDDSHDSVLLASVKAIQAGLSCYTNENYFNLTENLCRSDMDTFTAPIFRSRPELGDGFLHGGYWKYSTKPSNIVIQIAPHVEDGDCEEGGPTIQDDVVVAGQDFAAGLVRMGILPRICYLLEIGAVPFLEESLVSVLVAIARHSPTSAHAILKCPRLIQTVVSKFTRQGMTEVSQSQIKAITLLKVLSQSSNHICSDFVKKGIFQQAMWHWYKKAINLEQWIANGIEQCRLASELMVEQLRFWKVCICYGLCITNFADFFPAMCLWLNPPNFVKLIENNALAEFTSVTTEAYHVLEALAKKLPTLHSAKQLNKQETLSSNEMSETWSWSHVTPLVDSAAEWLVLSNIPYVSSVIGCQDEGIEHCEAASLSFILWLISAVLHFLCGVFDRIAPLIYCDTRSTSPIPWLPLFVPKVCIEFIKGGFLDFCRGNGHFDKFSAQNGHLSKALCLLRNQNNFDLSLSSVSCLQGIFQFAFLVDQLVKRARSTNLHPKVYESGASEKILEEGILKSTSNEVSRVLSGFMNIVSTGWSILQPIETFGRGGPAPGVGIGWGSAHGGFWSLNVLLAQEDAHLTIDLLKIALDIFENDLFGESINAAPTDSLAIQSINSILGVCLIAGPGDRAVLGKAFDLLLQAPMLNYLNNCISHLLQSSKSFPVSNRLYGEEDLILFSDLLNTHYRKRWLGIKRKSSNDKADQNVDVPKRQNVLETIHEEMEQGENDAEPLYTNSLLVEWAYQRLPLPSHWFLSAICAIGDSRNNKTCAPSEVIGLAKSGLFFLLGLEAMSSLVPSGRISAMSGVPLIWKLHALSMSLHENMDVLEDAACRDSFEILQQLYGKLLDGLKGAHVKAFEDQAKRSKDLKMPSKDQVSDGVDLLSFQASIHENYTTFLENIVDQFGAVSYGNIIFGRQVALYLHRAVESTVRLAAWNALSSAHTLELLPPIEDCMGSFDGYLEPAEDNEAILEAYAKSWSSGMLDRAAARGSMSFALAVHHLSSFIFKTDTAQKSTLRFKLIKSLLRRSNSQKPGNEGMLHSFILHGLTSSGQSLNDAEIKRRLELLKEACQGNASLLAEVDKLSTVQRRECS